MGMKNLEELRSALDYYEDVYVNSNLPVMGTFANGCSINRHRLILRRGLFVSRYISLEDAVIKRIPAAEGSEAYRIINSEETVLLILSRPRENDKIILHKRKEMNEHDLAIPACWDKSMCFYDMERDISAIGVDVHRFDYRNVLSTSKLTARLSHVGGRLNGQRDFMLDYVFEDGDIPIPAFIIEDGNIYLDIVGGISGIRATYKRIKPKLTEQEIKEIHSFADGMKDAYNVLYEPVKTCAQWVQT